MTFNIARTLSEMAARFPERPALICRSCCGWKSHTFQELERTVNGLAHGLTARGIQRGDRVMLLVTPSLDFISLTFALFKMGAVVILIDPGMGLRNMARSIASVKPDIFIGIPKAWLFRCLFPQPFRSVRASILVNGGPGLFFPLKRLLAETDTPFAAVEADGDELAAIIFTTGSTGPPKGVQYTHAVFAAQLELIRAYYQIGPEDIDQPAFPLFALFSAALGACAVIPEMNPARPARVNPEKFIRSINRFKVTYSFGSPAIWNVVSRYCLRHGVQLPSLKKVLMAGAPVPGELIERVRRILPADGEVHVPYGATESLPVTSISGAEVLGQTWKLTETGAGTCVGRPLPGNEVRVLKSVDGPLAVWDENLLLGTGEIGEIVVRGPVVTRAYDHNDAETTLAKIRDRGTFWHRLGDLGYLDEQGRLWFCGRKNHRVRTASGILYTIPCETFFNAHPLVRRSALVGVEAASGSRIPVLIVEPYAKVKEEAKLVAELTEIARSHEQTRQIGHFLIHPAMPVDIRHNAKIFREKLALWASERLSL